MNYHISKFYFSYAILKALVCFLLFKINYSAPINSSVTYANFLKEIKHDNCVFPKEVVLPFNSSTTFFEILEVHIKICSPSEEVKVKRSREAVNLCSDIFNILKNITCHPDPKVQLPEIRIEFSKNVCANISSLQFAPESKTLLKHLTDRLVCDMMCDDEFNPACQALLWGYQVQQQINSAAVVVQEKNEQKIETKSGNPESENVEDVRNEVIADTENKDEVISGNADNSQINVLSDKNEVNSGNADNSQINVLADKKVSAPEVFEKLSSLEAPNNNSSTTPAEENSAKVDLLPVNEKGKSENIKEEIPVKNVNNIENQNKSKLLDKEKESTNQISTLDIKTGQDNHAIVKVEELPLADNEIQTDNVDKASTPNKNKQSDVSGQKPVPAKAGLVEEVESKDLNLIQSGKKAETKSSNKSETKMRTQTDLNIETSKGGITAPDTKDMNVMPDKIKIKDTKITTLKTEEQKVGNAEVANKNAITESFTKEASEDASPVTTAADLEKMEDGIEMPVPSDKNQEPYNMENEGDYSKLDYADDADDGFYESSKNIKPAVVEDSKMPAVESQNDLPKYDPYQPRNSVGHGVEDIQVIPAFPEQEDSHFFFYFLSIVIILMGGYLLFHNKQKIIALIVEGRHERRRRSHGVGYKKLETK